MDNKASISAREAEAAAKARATFDHDEKGALGEPIVGRHVMPAALAALDSDEYNKVGKAATRKLDCVVMPCIVIMCKSNLNLQPVTISDEFILQTFCEHSSKHARRLKS